VLLLDRVLDLLLERGDSRRELRGHLALEVLGVAGAEDGPRLRELEHERLEVIEQPAIEV